MRALRYKKARLDEVNAEAKNHDTGNLVLNLETGPAALRQALVAYLMLLVF